MTDVQHAVCPLCHTASHGITMAGVTDGGTWRCIRCGQTWDSRRLDAVASFRLWQDSQPAGAPGARH